MFIIAIKYYILRISLQYLLLRYRLFVLSILVFES